MKSKYLIGVLFLAFCLNITGQNADKKSEKQDSGIVPQPVPINNVECLFDPTFRVQTTAILSESEARTIGVPLCLVRTANNKLAVMAKDRTGNLQPFYMKGIETGFWDTRNKDTINFNVVFDTYRKMGANATMFMIHWIDIEPEDGKFDFSFTDSIVSSAQRHGLKVVWVLFMHEQNRMLKKSEAENLWMYNLETRDGADYAMQWIKNKNGVIVKDIAAQKQQFSEIMPCYGNPLVYNRIIRMLGKLGEHYKNSESVIGVQIGNEEGISFQGSDADFNPHTLTAFERWKKLTGKSSWTEFKLAIVKLLWSRFTTAYHLHDPYKLTMFNPEGGVPEQGDINLIARTGTDVTTFRDSKIDVIATMFYKANASRIWNNLDRIYTVNNTYSYPTKLPILMSTEIGIGRFNLQSLCQEYMINFLERGSQGFAVYDYGELADGSGVINTTGVFYQKFMSMVKANEDIIWPGLPGAGDNISISTTTNGAKVSCLHKDNNATLGILHFPNATDQSTLESQADVPIGITVKKTGVYVTEIYKDGTLTSSRKDKMTASKCSYVNITLSNKAASFIKVTMLNPKQVK